MISLESAAGTHGAPAARLGSARGWGCRKEKGGTR